MMIEVDRDIMTGIVRAWLKDNLEVWQAELDGKGLHPQDVKPYKKDIKAVKHILDYIGYDG